jgi:shikimate kinase
MPEQFTLNLATGAPGAGKSTSAQLCAATQSSYLAFDMDCLIDSASSLSQKDVHVSPETWPPYNALWMDVIQAVLRNGAEAARSIRVGLLAGVSSRPVTGQRVTR